MKRESHHVGKRLLSVDSLRGLAMVLVILQHSYLSANRGLVPRAVDMLMWLITESAAIAFVSISGMMYSYFLYVKPDWKQTYRHYLGRALFVIVGAHFAIGVTGYYFRSLVLYAGTSSRSPIARLFLEFPITDTIGMCIILSPLVIVYFAPKYRALTIAAMLLVSAWGKTFVVQSGHAVLLLKEAIFGTVTLPEIFWFPIVPWLAIFISGSFVGQALAQLKNGRMDENTLIRKLNKAAGNLAVCSVVLTIGYKLFELAFHGRIDPNVLLAIYPGQTTTLLPGYFALLLWILAAWIQRIDVRGRYDRFLWLLSIFGRTSLFTFVIQFAIVESIPALLGYKRSLTIPGFALLFGLGLIATWCLAYLYGRRRGWIKAKDYEKLAVHVREMHNAVKASPA